MPLVVTPSGATMSRFFAGAEGASASIRSSYLGLLLSTGRGDKSTEVVPAETDISVETAVPIGMLLVKFCNKVFGVSGTVSPDAHEGDSVWPAQAMRGPSFNAARLEGQCATRVSCDGIIGGVSAALDAACEEAAGSQLWGTAGSRK